MLTRLKVSKKRVAISFITSLRGLQFWFKPKYTIFATSQQPAQSIEVIDRWIVLLRFEFDEVRQRRAVCFFSFYADDLCVARYRRSNESIPTKRLRLRFISWSQQLPSAQVERPAFSKSTTAEATLSFCALASPIQQRCKIGAGRSVSILNLDVQAYIAPPFRLLVPRTIQQRQDKQAVHFRTDENSEACLAFIHVYDDSNAKMSVVRSVRIGRIL